MLGQQRRQPFARAWREGRDHHAATLPLQGAHVACRGLEHVAVGGGALGREIAARPALERAHHAARGVRRLLEGRHAPHGALGQQPAPLVVAEEHGCHRHRLVGRRPEGQRLQALDARVVVLADQLEPLAHRLVGQMVEADRGVRHVVEQRLQMLVEQRQPVLQPRIALAGADRLVQRVLGLDRAEHLDVAAPEALLGIGPEGRLADRHQGQLLHDLRRALRFRIERLHLLQRVAEEVEAHRGDAAGRKHVDDAAAHRILAGLHDGAGALEAGQAQPLHQPVHVHALAGGDGLQRLADELARRHALQDGVDRGQHDGRIGARARHQPRQRGDAGGHDLRVRADAVVGHGVPGREGDDAHLRGEEFEPLGQRLQAPVVARHVQQQRRRACALPCTRFVDQLRQHQRPEPIRHAGEDLAGGGRLGLRFMRVVHRRSPPPP